jgi:hypothetical protein
MKSILLLVAASLMLLGATVVVSIPIVEAAVWCGPIGPCSNGKGQCEKVQGNEGLCVKQKPGL